MNAPDHSTSDTALLDRPPPGTGRRVQIFAGSIAALLVFGFIAVEASRIHNSSNLAVATEAALNAPPPVDVVTVKPAGASAKLTLPGETAAWYESTIYARVSGYVATWLVDIGDTVKSGQVLATIDTPELDAELLAAKAKLKSAMAEMQVRKAEADFAESTNQRWQSSPKGVVSEQEREDKKAQAASAAAQLAAAQAQVSLVQADIDRLTAFQEFKSVRAPFAGTIVERRIDIGNLVTAGSNEGTTPLYRMTQDDPIRVFVDVPQSTAGALKPGVPASVSLDGRGGAPIRGEVTRTAGAVDPQSRTFRVEVDLPNKDASLLPGQYVHVAFDVAGVGTAEIPGAALLLRAAGPEVAVVGPDDQVRFRKVAIASDNGATVALASGVQPGEKVVLNIASQIADGTKVRVSETDGQMASVR